MTETKTTPGNNGMRGPCTDSGRRASAWALLFLVPSLAWSATYTVINTNDIGAGSLRQAILDANANGGPDNIDFNIPTTDPGYTAAPLSYTIQPATALPDIDDPVVLDGETQPDFPGTPIIVVDGSLAGGAADGLVLNADDSTIRGLVINQFGDDGMEVNGDNNFIEGNYIGTDVTGTIARPNDDEGVDIGGQNNTIGGTTVAARNIISGNNNNGVNADDRDNFIQGNYIGTNATGTGALGNDFGILVRDRGTTIGGTIAAARNVISGNRQSGIRIETVVARNTVVQGNYIGTDASGTADLGNAQSGVLIDGGTRDNLIGGTTVAARNIISANDQSGVQIEAAGTTGNLVQGNYIGTDASGTAPLGNSQYGVFFNSSAFNNTIGGTAAGAANLIANNGRDGVALSTSAGTGNAIQTNIIFANTGLGIDLNDDNVTVNDLGLPHDTDGGPNNTQNYPNLCGSTGGANTTIVGTLASTPSTTFRLEFFSSPPPGDPSGNGEGEIYLGFDTVVTDVNGDVSFATVLPVATAIGDIVAATATDTTTNVSDTSEFSNAVTVSVSTPACIAKSFAPNPIIVGGTSTLTLTIINPNTFGLTGVAVSDTYPVEITNATPNNGATTCAGGTVTAVDGGPSVALTGGTIPAGGSCTVSVDVTSVTPGAYLNTTGVVTTNEVPASTTTSSTLEAVAPICLVITTADAGPGSLRNCIIFANSNPGITIQFNIPGPGNRSAGADTWWGISPVTPLPAITAAATVIDGTTQTTNQGDTNSRGPEIELDGLLAGAAAHGLVIGATGGGSTIRGLVVQNFVNNGILLLGGSNLIAGNYLGISADGTTVAANNPAAVNFQGGIRVESASNTIGGAAAADRNVISGNGFAGIELFGAGATGNMVYGNYIGVDATGTLARGNTQEGLDLDLSSSNIIGGPGAGQRNIISGNGSDGIEIDGGDSNVIQGNYIGTDLTGTLVIPNVRDGIDINENGVDGAIDNLIGGTGANEGNLIRGNTIYGVQVRGAPVIDNSILGNQIYDNVALDIDLNNDGITVNDPLDADSGSNDLLNFPVIISATETAGTLDVDFELDVPAGDYRIEFFSNPSGAHGTGNGGGEVFAGALTITHGGTGVELFTHSFAGSAGDIITSTATEEIAGPAYDSTSEFSAAFTAIAPFSARWPLDETSGVIAADVDAGNDGTYQNGVLLNQTAACTNTGNAVYFDGLDDFVEVPHSADYLIDEGTVTLWANVDALGTAQSFFSKDSTGFDTGGHLTINVQPGGQVRVRLQSTTGDNIVNSAPVSPATWFHVAFSWGPAGMALYLDGAAPVTNPYTGGLSTTSGGAGNFEPIAFGASTKVSGNLIVTPTEEHLAGFMDDVRIYDRALTQPEIQTLSTCATSLDIVKRAFWLDGTPIPTGATVPSGVEFKYLLYVNNRGIARTDVTVRDVLDAAFLYQAGTIQVDNSVAECAAAACTPLEEQAIFAAVDGAAVLSDAIDGDVASYTGAGTTIDAGNGNVANLQLDINADAVWAILFSAKMP